MAGVLQSPVSATATVSTLEEGIALALAMCPPGKAITIHAKDCGGTDEHPEACNCEPRVIIAPPRGIA